MRIALVAGQTMKRVSDDTYDIQNEHIKMTYIRKCGCHIDYSRKDEDCGCTKCTHSRMKKVCANSISKKVQGDE